MSKLKYTGLAIGKKTINVHERQKSHIDIPIKKTHNKRVKALSI